MEEVMGNNNILALLAVEYWKLLRAFERTIDRLPHEHVAKTAAQMRFSATVTMVLRTDGHRQIAVVASLVRGGRFHRLAKAPLRWVWLLFVGVALQLAADGLVIADVLEATGGTTYGLLLASQLLVIVWVLAIWQLPGLVLVAIGLLMNATVMAANGAMPVDPDAIAALGRDADDLVRGKHVVMDEDTRLPWLADIWPVPPLRSIISIGDVVLAAGLIPITHHLMTYRPPKERRRRGKVVDDEEVGDISTRGPGDAPRPDVGRGPGSGH
jgi:hypothetical protein